MAEAQRELVEIEEGTIAAMAQNSEYLKEFPFLAPVAAKPRGCGKCGAAAQARTQAFSAAKAAIAGLASDKKRRLKELLNAKKARITYTSAGGKVVQLTF